ncbi:MAG: IS200/IS605 family transposase [Cyanobacteria bacterium CAN_BIN43]|nr:IS200/IS605 family transposase [Cyanobacteria bacterium CAN_BIN43]
MSRKLKHYAHAVCGIQIYIVFCTKYRHPVFTQAMESRLKTLLEKLCTTQKCELLEIKADLEKRDHVHLLVEVAPDIAVSKLVNILKTISSRELRKEFAEHLKPYYWKPVFWKRGYCAVSAGGASLEVLKQYIESQGYDD